MVSTKPLDEVAAFFRSLADPFRLKILYLLTSGELSVQEIVEASGGHQANVSKHLKHLFDEGFVARRKEGTRVFYRIEEPMVLPLCSVVCDRQRHFLEERAALFQGEV